jgi:hypothetical protein
MSASAKDVVEFISTAETIAPLAPGG